MCKRPFIIVILLTIITHNEDFVNIKPPGKPDFSDLIRTS